MSKILSHEWFKGLLGRRWLRYKWFTPCFAPQCQSTGKRTCLCVHNSTVECANAGNNATKVGTQVGSRTIEPSGLHAVASCLAQPIALLLRGWRAASAVACKRNVERKLLVCLLFTRCSSCVEDVDVLYWRTLFSPNGAEARVQGGQLLLRCIRGSARSAPPSDANLGLAPGDIVRL